MFCWVVKIIERESELLRAFTSSVSRLMRGTPTNSKHGKSTKGRQLDKVVVTGGIVSFRNDNLRCQPWPQSCQIDYLLFSVNGACRPGGYYRNYYTGPLPYLGQWNWFLPVTYLNTLRPRQNGRHFPDDIFKCIFLNENVWISIKI